MLPWIIQMSIISLVLIILIHYLYTFFQTNLTIPKVKDLVNKPQKQYDLLFNVMKENTSKNSKPEVSTTDPSSKELMKTELKNYLKELSETKQNTNSNRSYNNNKNDSMLMVDNLMSSNTFSSNAYSTF